MKSNQIDEDMTSREPFTTVHDQSTTRQDKTGQDRVADVVADKTVCRRALLSSVVLDHKDITNAKTVRCRAVLIHGQAILQTLDALSYYVFVCLFVLCCR